MSAEGMLAIWSDVAREAETDYLHWLTHEHALERLSIPGFLSVRVFRAMDLEVRRYFILYRLQSPSVLSGEDYVARLNNPTPWSQRIMPTLANFVRGGGQVSRASGSGYGGFAAAVMLDDAQRDQAETLIPGLVKMDRICSACLLKVDSAKTSIATHEKSLRREDQSFANLLLFDGVDAAAIRSALGAIGFLPADTSARQPVYGQIYQQDRRQART